MNNSNHRIPVGMLGIISAIGIVYGDIGTSPLYVLKAIIYGLPDNQWSNAEYILGAVSCIIWTLTLQTTLKYVIITLKADNKGEGGILSLYALIRRRYRWAFVVAIIGAAALLADGAITPAITIITAVEGLNSLYSNIPIIPVTLLIIFVLFLIQPLGTAALGRYFGVGMTIWFSTLAILGLNRLLPNLDVLAAFNPMYAIEFIIKAPDALVILGAIFMCTTGAEALYSDLGHCGLKNIRISWGFVKVCLIVNYLGQAAWIIHNPELVDPTINPFYMMMPEWFRLIGIIMSTVAAFIACQALISGAFTIISEAISLELWPNVHIRYPTLIKGQMYIPSINYTLFVLCALMVIGFGSSVNLEAAYGLAITLSMLMTTILLFFYFMKNNKPLWYSVPLTFFFLLIESGFFVANAQKFFHGGYASILIAGLIFVMMYAWYCGRRIKREYNTFDRLDKDYLAKIVAVSHDKTIEKVATHLFYLTRAQSPHSIESKISFSLFEKKPKRADTYWFVGINRMDEPYQFDYEIEILVPYKVFRININLGFKVDMHAEQYIQLIATKMEQQNLVCLSSRYSSLKEKRGDSLYVIVERTLRNVDIYFVQKPLLVLYTFIKRKFTSDTEMFDLDPTSTLIEYVPIVANEYENDCDTLKQLIEQSHMSITGQLPEEEINENPQQS
ncbi:KUP system potassium uptake protein [Orbus hercynius]|uniref:KUP system potassium uptake protein n=1 Tax=Orbus hercynius TaxID=593135 RepID=A0A495RCX1_9GAMM|nr:KUP/HAK/KT family potassium transporter [Orbus hercynius]RKS85201.1 KUP system potassium uptake protein [Orbus hercynius]